ncbi:MAG: hypothetical protein IJM79_07665 [Erysipelotrichaceae bacterium]|nr:hypothetical protein [Erysipelotrichaceae bacterium]
MKKLRSLAEELRTYLLRPHFVICLAIAWFITNGWAYLGVILGKVMNWNWLLAVSTGYLAFLWMPMTPEKIITLMIAALLSKILFPRDLDNLRSFSSLRQSLISRNRRT